MVNTTYEEITIPMPQPPGVPNLPTELYFYLDNRFSTAQKLRMRNLIVALIIAWRQHYLDKSVSGISALAACTDEYAIRGLVPVWFSGTPFTSGADALNYAMDVLASRFRDNGFRRVRTNIDYYEPTSREKTTAFAFSETSYRRTNVALSVRINQTVLSNLSISNLTLVSSLFHAWLHRSGYRHPNNVYTSYLIGEAAMCVARGNQNKVAGQADTVWTRFFD